MAGWRQVVELAMSEEEIGRLTTISRSRTEPASRVARAQMLLCYRENPSFFAVGKRLGTHHQVVQRCVERAVAYGPLTALDDRPRPGKEPTITALIWACSTRKRSFHNGWKCSGARTEPPPSSARNQHRDVPGSSAPCAA